MYFKIKPIILLLLFILLLSGCSVERMRYSKGLHIQWPSYSDPTTVSEKPYTPQKKPTISNEITTANAGSEIDPTLVQTMDFNLYSVNDSIIPKDSCHIIRLKDGSIIYSKYIEIAENDIKYIDCNYSEKLHKIDKTEVKSIRYKNGLEENQETLTTGKKTDSLVNMQTAANSESAKHAEIISRRSIIFGICAFCPVIGWIFAFMAIGHASNALHTINKDPNLEIYRKNASTGLALGITALILGIIVLITSLVYSL